MIKLGTSDISKVYFGADEITKAYLGSTEVYSSASFFLDTYSGALAAWSLQSIKATTTNVIKARRSSDDAELDFTAAEITDGTLTTWTGSGDGFVTTIYDQIGSNNYTQTTSGRQGQIVSSGSVITLGGKPCIVRSSDNNGGYISTYAPNDGATVKGVFFVGDNNSKDSTISGSVSGGNDYGGIVQSGSSGGTIDTFNAAITKSELNGLTTTYINRGEAYTATDLHFLLYREIEFSFSNNALGLGYRSSNPSNLGMFTFQEQVIFGNTSDATAKQNNINGRYTIY